MNKLSKILITVYCLLFIVYFVYSYAFLDVGLTLTSFVPYLNFQKKMQWFGYFDRPKSTVIFIILTLLLFTIYYLLFTAFKKRRISLKEVLILTGVIAGVLIFSYPAFSHDIFNYIFNAKMVLIYQVDPHKHVAMEFSDPMLGFMRNIHTAAPYFYGWTIISLIPFIFAFNRIFPEIISFKLFSVLFFLLTFLILKKIYSKYKLKDDKLRLVLFLLNPLILIEAIGVGHNDFAMMLPALASFYFLVRFKNKKRVKFLLFSVFCFLFSVSIKYATIVLLPLLILWYLKSKFDLGFWGGILLFLIQFSRPGLMHSWYLIWPLTWVMLAKNIRWVYFFCLLSFFSLLRYTPYIWYGHWDPPVGILRLIIYFLIPSLVLVYWFLRRIRERLVK
jgi:hypothetical protein